jgi:hypothetical protein
MRCCWGNSSSFLRTQEPITTAAGFVQSCGPSVAQHGHSGLSPGSRSLVRDDVNSLHFQIPFSKFQTAKTHLRIPAARSARVVLDLFTLDNRGRRESRVPIAPMGPVQKSTGVGPQVQPESLRLSRAVVYGLLRALPGDRAFLPPSSLKSLLLKNLTPASGRQDHTTSPSAGPRSRQKRRPRPPHPAPRS